MKKTVKVLPEKNIDISIIVPLFNEQESIVPLYNALMQSIQQLKLSYEIIFVDDGSTDKTVELGIELARSNKNLRMIVFRANAGQTPAMVAGIDHAKGKILVTMDGDLQNDPSDISNFIDKINEGFDIVVGWRHKRQDKLITRKIPSKIANWIIGKVTGVPIKDNGCSLKAYRAKVIKNVPLYSEMHRFIPAMTSVTGAKIAEIKVRHHPRKYGTSKYGLSRIYKVIFDLIAIKTLITFSSSPFVGSSIPAIFSGILAIIIFIFGIIKAIALPESSLVVIIGSSLLFGFLSIFLFSIGILGELIYKTGNLKSTELSQLTALMDFTNIK